MVGGHSMGPGIQLVGARFLNFHLGKLSREFKFRPISIFHEIQMAIFRYCVTLQSRGWACRYRPICTVYVDVTLTRSKVKVTWLLNFRQLAKPCMLAAMTAAPLWGFLVTDQMFFLSRAVTSLNCKSLSDLDSYIVLL